MNLKNNSVHQQQFAKVKNDGFAIKNKSNHLQTDRKMIDLAIAELICEIAKTEYDII